ncbi:aldehyde dehydrogenase family protein [Cupriavidus basilensis]
MCSRPPPRRHARLGERLRAGRIFCNGAGGNVVAPMGGYKQSGNGREMGGVRTGGVPGGQGYDWLGLIGVCLKSV